jgi:hypothetical protein
MLSWARDHWFPQYVTEFDTQDTQSLVWRHATASPSRAQGHSRLLLLLDAWHANLSHRALLTKPGA